jgi:hypothetical protein
MKKRILSSLVLLLLLGTACTPSGALPKEDQLATIVASTLTAQPVFTPIPTFTAMPVPTSTATSIPTDASPPVVTASGPLYIHTAAQNVNLRTQPGTLFPVSRVMAQGTRLQVLGLSPGGEWAYVLNEEGINGWVDISFVDAFPSEQLLTVEPGDVQRITGRVLDANGLPVHGVGFAIVQQTASKSLRTDAVTDATGTFYAYLPLTASGVWTVSYVSLDCKSNAMDANCNCLSNVCSPDPVSIPVSLPVNVPLNYTWK